MTEEYSMHSSAKKKLIFFSVFVSLLGLTFFFIDRGTDLPSGYDTYEKRNLASTAQTREISRLPSSTANLTTSLVNKGQIQAEKAQALSLNEKESDNSQGVPVKFVLEDGVAVTQGDLIVGALVEENTESESLKNSSVILPIVKLWPSSTIPYHIDEDVPNPERILQALSFFEGTSVKFVPYSSQPAAIVFTNGSENCKSYIGYHGILQPIMLSPDCKPDDIAHEVMHALGFIHEQSRSDRDQYVEVMSENIEDGHQINFEKLPPGFMAVSGLSPFDFESLMIYPSWMFAKSGNVTMQAKTGQRIEPSKELSSLDRERVNRAYENR